MLGPDVAYRRTLGPTVGRLVCGFDVKCGQTCQKCGFIQAKAFWGGVSTPKKGVWTTRQEI